MINFTVSDTCLRYVIPFTFEENFDEVCARVDSQKTEEPGNEPDLVWKRVTPERLKEESSQKHKGLDDESDLYTYIWEEFMFDSDKGKLSENKMGAQWTRRKEELNNPLMELLYLKQYEFNKRSRKNDESDQNKGKNQNKQKESFDVFNADTWKNMLKTALNVNLRDMGLYLFRNGLGFLWYELSLVKPKTAKIQKPKDGPITTEELMEFQRTVKELNKDQKVRLLKKQAEPGPISFDEPYEETVYLSPFYPGQMVADTLRFLNVSYLTYRKSHDGDMDMRSDKFTKAYLYGLEKLELGAELPDEYVRANKGPQRVLPDKAVLFSYGVMTNPQNREELGDEEDRYRLTYYLTNGYNTTYDCSPDIVSEIIRPFNNAYWFASKEGVSYFKWPNAENEGIFRSVIRTNVKRDYFVLFIKAIYQSYSLQLLGRKIQDDIPAEHLQNMKKEDFLKVERRYEETNLFLTKNMATSVSHIDHQSVFYSYLKRRLRIAEDANSISAGLEALEALQKEKRDEEEKERDDAVQNTLGIISLLAIASALIDSFDFISMFALENDMGWKWLKDEHLKVFIAELIVIGVIVVISVYAIKRFRENRKGANKGKKEKERIENKP